MIVCVSPSSQHYDETQNTLRYANRAKNIQTKSVRNVYNVDRHVKDYLKKIDEQMNRINELQAQQKQHEELAFAKFRKAEAKRGEIVHEGVIRIRAAYDHSSEERKERINNMKRLRQIERRIGAISGWIGAFDQVCETREEEEPPASLTSMRKTAQGILVELEGSRQHYHQRLAKTNWTRAIDTALQDGLRQLQGLDGALPDSPEEMSLHKEVEILKNRAEIDAHIAVLEQEKAGEAGLMQVMLTAQFETIAILNQILQMSEEEAVQAAREVLAKLLTSCTEATGQVIKPDGGLQIVEAVPPTRNGTPRKRKQVPLMGPSPLKNKIRPSPHIMASAVPAHLASELPAQSPHTLSSSPIRGATASPRRRVKLGGARKGVAFTGTPKKKSPAKKRVVRWRDDTDDGSLVEYQPTPKGFDSTPEDSNSSGTVDLPTAPSFAAPGMNDEQDSSPLLSIPPPSNEARKPAAGRFAVGALAKKSDGSPPLAPPPTLNSLVNSSSEDEISPLREMAANSAPHATRAHKRASSLHNVQTPSSLQSDPENDAASSGSGSETEKSFPASKEDAANFRSAMKIRRSSSLNHGSTNPRPNRESIHRRRSPTATSPPPDGIFSASHARRMVKPEREDALRSVLSPRTAPVTKGNGPVPVRRSMVEASVGTPREGVAARGPMRQSSVVPGSAQRVSRGVWR
jgi:kinesin family protein 18/19